MKELKVKEKIIMVDDEDYERLSTFKWHIGGGKHASIDRTYKKENKYIYVSFANEVMKTEKILYDHIDRNPFNNQKSNLRACSARQNACNRVLKGKNKYIGVRTYPYPYNNRFYVRIQVDRKSINVGCFDNEVEAAKAFDKAALKYHGEFAVLNFPAYAT